ncbi:hypothetical protein RclHR1_02500003 [Rhizophagus clarus]|uniref:SAM domain-containing protein n=1 Tax=Rhizophagus clarus TaxID=94130 RepID=A0A2Z6RBF6_9GLOM|nr:hypothetical protein RclHR1_02500003 [Rhizophagus clarus]GES80682.1 hypothetical protein GLOIN_2v1522857 [Rhizophagus clarus]
MLDDNNLEILHNEKIDGSLFLNITEEKFMQTGLKMGLAIKLTKEVQVPKEKLKSMFSLYLSLSKVLAKYSLTSEGTEVIPSLPGPRHY